jgi:hypothetical protein
MKEDETGHVAHMGDMRNTVYTRGSPTMGCAPSRGAIGFLGVGGTRLLYEGHIYFELNMDAR